MIFDNLPETWLELSCDSIWNTLVEQLKKKQIGSLNDANCQLNVTRCKDALLITNTLFLYIDNKYYDVGILFTLDKTYSIEITVYNVITDGAYDGYRDRIKFKLAKRTFELEQKQYQPIDFIFIINAFKSFLCLQASAKDNRIYNIERFDNCIVNEPISFSDEQVRRSIIK